MIADLKPYPAYKGTGVPWLGEVPEHWEVPRLGALVRERGETNDDNSVIEVLSLMRERGVIPYAEKGNVGNKKSEDITRYKIVRPDDIVVNCMNVIIGSVGLSKYTGCLSPVYYVLTRRSETDNPRYLNAYFQTKPFQVSLVRIGNGILAHRMRIPMELLKCEPFPRPPADEQTAIVRFLDHADRRIRRYILAKQKLIKLLEEQKQAIIHHAVTRGLDPDVRLKPSGVEWLGDVPEHWEVSQIRSVAQVVRGGSPRPAGSPLYFHGISAPWITVGEITKDSGMYLVETSTRLTPAGAERSRMIEVGTLLLTNSGATLGVPKISLIHGCINDGVAAFLNLRSRVNKEFLYFYWSTQTAHLKAWVDLGAQPNLNTQIIGGWPVPLPTTDEQEAIVQHIRQETVLLADTIDRARREISILREYRTRLIADVVTGKLDVREAAAKLPEETDEPEPLDDAEAHAEGDEETEGANLDAVTEEAEA
jgi:type I restriction enzyme S subunit